MNELYANDTLAEARRVFDKLSKTFEEEGINPTPVNYLVWYAYLKGDNVELRKEMDEIMADPFGYHDREGRRLYEEYLRPCDDSEPQFDIAFRRLLNAIAKKFNEWSSKLDSETEQLAACSANLNDPNLSSDQIREITKIVLETAESIKEDSESMKEDVINSAEEVKRLREELVQAKAAVLTDELTEVGNRKAFNQAIAELTTAVEEDELQSVCLIMTDIDHFKRFNDEFGHLVGDSVLRYFASIMKRLATDNQTVCRYGGEEFGILVTNESLEEVAEKAEKIRSTLEHARLKRKGSERQIGKITASFGVACYRPGEEIDTFIARSDQALYYAKEHGRNQVITEKDINA